MENIFFNKESNFKNETISSIPVGNNNITINKNDVDLKKDDINNIKPMLTGNSSTIFIPDNKKVKIKPVLNKKVPLDAFSSIANPKKNLGSTTSSDESGSEYDSDSSGDESSEQLLRNNNNNTRGNSQSDDESEEDDYSSIGSERTGNLKSNSSVDEDDSDDDDDSDDSEVQPKKSYEDIQKEKQKLLFDLERLQKQGYAPSKRYSMASAIDELQFERDRLKKQRDVEKSIGFSRKVLMAVVSGIEYLNGSFDPFDIKLKGWSENVMENVNDYDEVFEELHEKYGDKVKMAPELKLLMMIAGSGFMFHLTNSLFKSAAPNLNDVLKQNPDIMRNITEAAARNMSQNIGQKFGENDVIGNMMRDGIQMKMANNRPGPQNRMSGPSGVDDLLNELSSGDDIRDDVSVSSNGSYSIKTSSRKTKNGKSKRVELTI
jgi:hypothetical protein